eukprot:m.69631 g.69631  ORF g.69631 m.69631 type:complete len:153 (+) comp16788_c0_seq2:38-496(+)
MALHAPAVAELETVEELVTALKDLQAERFQAFDLFEEGFSAHLKSAPHYQVPVYQALVHDITQAFTTLSLAVCAVRDRLRTLGRADLSVTVQQLQDAEEEKLKLTVAYQIARQKHTDGDESVLEDSLHALKSRIAQASQRSFDIFSDLREEL